MTFDPGNRLIAALDLPDRQQADQFVDRLDGAASWVKVGLELFIAGGPDVVRDYTERGCRVMLDLKLHDIPATVGRAVRRAAGLGAGLLTIHTAGGRAMMEAAVQAARDAAPESERVRLLAVSVLTSLDRDDLAEVGTVCDSVEELVAKRAQLAVAAGCDGLVSSPLEAARLRAMVPDDFLIVTPGIRPSGAATGDQKRVMTPARARRAGADLIVVGRPIRDADDPVTAARAIVAELAE